MPGIWFVSLMQGGCVPIHENGLFRFPTDHPDDFPGRGLSQRFLAVPDRDKGLFEQQGELTGIEAGDFGDGP